MQASASAKEPLPNKSRGSDSITPSEGLWSIMIYTPNGLTRAEFVANLVIHGPSREPNWASLVDKLSVSRHAPGAISLIPYPIWEMRLPHKRGSLACLSGKYWLVGQRLLNATKYWLVGQRLLNATVGLATDRMPLEGTVCCAVARVEELGLGRGGSSRGTYEARRPTAQRSGAQAPA